MGTDVTFVPVNGPLILRRLYVEMLKFINLYNLRCQLEPI